MSKKLHFFIDESGDPNFYARRKRPLWTEPNFEPVLMLGMIAVEDRKALRHKIIDFQNQILKDPLFNTISSLMKSDWFLHASKDHVEVRLKFIEFLRTLDDIRFYGVIGRKTPEIFHSKHNGNAAEFYFDLLNKLLAQFDFEKDSECILYLSQKQSNTVERFINALEKALIKQSKHISHATFKCSIVLSSETPELSVVDYFLWTLKRYITTGDRRYFAALENKFIEIYDVYENGGKGVIYDNNNSFELSKASNFMIK